MQSDAEELLMTLEQKVEPAHAALIVVDVQNDFCAEGGYFHRAGYDLANIQRTVPPLARLLDHARAAGVCVIFIQAIYDANVLSAAMRERNRRRNLEQPRCLTGTWGADFYVVRPRPGEPVIIKHRYSGFAGTELEQVLRARGIRSLLLTGVSTDTCVESTAREGYFRDFYVTLVADCCGALSDADQRSALARADRDFAAVVTSAEVIQAWERLGAPAPTTLAGSPKGE